MANVSRQASNGWQVVDGADVNQYGLTKLDDDETFFPIAIVGIGCRTPGAADHWQFREILKHKLTTYEEIPDERWSREEWYSGDGSAKLGFTNSTHAGFLPYLFEFDNTFFRTSPKEAAAMDAQQFQVMETTQEALHDAGITPESLPQSTAAYISMKMGEEIVMNAENRHIISPYMLTGGSHTTTPNRVSFFYDLRGASMGVEGSCSAAMHSVHFGVWSLWNRECEAAIAGGVNYILSPQYHMQYCEHEMLSKKGVCNPFDAGADGRVRSEACGILVLKPLAHALRDNDHVHCVIRASTIGYHGKALGMGVHDKDSVAKVMGDMTERFGIPTEKVDYVEANASGIAEEDRMEAEALGEVFGKNRKAPLRVGSCKANIGHAETASGITQIAKAALMLQNREFYGQPNFQQMNPDIQDQDSKLAVQTKTENFTEDKNMLVGVNCFSFSGQIVSMLLEEFRQPEQVLAAECPAGWRFGAEGSVGRTLAIPLSAKGRAALRATAELWLGYDNPEEDAQVVVSWLATRRDHYTNRIVVLANSATDFRAKLQDFLDGKANDDVIEGSAPGSFTKPKICFVFPGQGQQWWDMGRQLFATEPVYRDVVQRCDGIWQREAGYSFLERHRVFVADKGDKPAGTIDEFTVTLPAVVVHELAMAELLKQWGIEPDLLVGHSLGEMAAAYFNGGLTLDEAVTFLCHRAMALSKVVGNGTMAAVRFTPEQADEFVKDYDDIFVGCYNSTESVTLSGKTETLQRLAKEMPTKVKIIRVTLANHTIFLRPAMNDFMQRTKGKYENKTGTGPQLYSAVTGDSFSGPFDADFWWRSIEKPVYFTQACQAIFRDHGSDVIFLEVAASATLLSIIRQTAKATSVSPVGYIPLGVRNRDDRKALLKGLAQMYHAGFPMDWAALTRDCAKYVRLPNYPFQRTYYRLQSEQMRQRRLGIEDKSFVGQHGELNVLIHPYLNDYEIRDQLVLPSSASVEFLTELTEDAEYPTLTDIRIPNHPATGRLDNTRDYTSLWLEPTKDDGAVAVKTKQHWSTDQKAGVVCASGILADRDAGLPSILDTTSIKSRCPLVLDNAEIYDGFWEAGLQYGPSFRIIEEIHLGDGEAIGILTSDDNKHETIQTVTLDAAFQIAHVAFVQSSSSLFVVRSIDRLQMNVPHLPRGERIQVYTRLTDWDSFRFRCDIYVTDRTGNVLTSIVGCHFEKFEHPGSQEEFTPLSCYYVTGEERMTGSKITGNQLAKGNGACILVRGREESELALTIKEKMQRTKTAIVSIKEFAVMATAGVDVATSVVYLWNPKNSIIRYSRGNLAESGNNVNFSDVTDVMDTCHEMAAAGVKVTLSVVVVTQAHQEAPMLAAYLRALSNATAEYNVSVINITRNKMDDVADDVITALSRGSDRAEMTVRGGELHRPVVRRLGGLRFGKSAAWEVKMVDSDTSFTAIQRPPLKAGEIRVAVRAFAAIESIVHCAGTVEEVGDGVAKWRLGDDVIAIGNGRTASSVVCKADDDVVRKPEALSWTAAARSGMTYGVVRYALDAVAKVQSKHCVYIADPTTPLGQACVAMATARKSKVICASGPENFSPQYPDVKLVDPTPMTFKRDLHKAAAGEGIDVIVAQESGVPDDVLELASDRCTLCLISFKSVEEIKFSVDDRVSTCVISVPDLFRRCPALARSSLQAALDMLEAGHVRDVTNIDDVIVGQEQSEAAVEATATTAAKAQRVPAVYAVPSDFRPSEAAYSELQLDPQALYAVLGGHGGVGQEVAKWLAAKGARHLAMVSRRGRTTVCHRFTSQKLISQGVTIHELRADISQDSQVVRLMDRLGPGSGLPPLRGIFHAACPMATAATSPADHSLDALQRVTRTQANSARSLHQEVVRRGINLDHFVLLSSSAQMLGHPGLPGLAASGAGLDALAEERQAAGLPALALHMGLVEGVGHFDSVPRAASLLKSAGIRPLPVRIYLDALERLLTATDAPPVVNVVNQDWHQAAKHCPRSEASFHHFLTNRASDGAQKLDEVTNAVLTRISNDLLWSRDEIDLDVPLKDLGYDIYLSRGLIARCQRDYSVMLTTEDISQGITPKQLIQRILTTH